MLDIVTGGGEGNKLLSAHLVSVGYEDIPLFVLTAVYFPRYEFNGTLLSLYAGEKIICLNSYKIINVLFGCA